MPGFKTFTSTTLSAADVNGYLMQQANIICTSATRPASPVEGMIVNETDTDRILRYSGTAWQILAGKQPYVRVYHSASQSVTATTSLLFDSETSDTDGFHSTVSNTSRLTVPTGLDGLYAITAGVFWQQNSTGGRSVRLKLNGTTYIAANVTPGATGADVLQGVTTLYALVAGDYLEVEVSQDSGSTLSVYANSSTTPSPRFAMTRIGPS